MTPKNERDSNYFEVTAPYFAFGKKKIFKSHEWLFRINIFPAGFGSQGIPLRQSVAVKERGFSLISISKFPVRTRTRAQPFAISHLVRESKVRVIAV